MNKPTRTLALSLFLTLAGSAWAQETKELRVVANDSEGAVLASSVVTVDSKLRFTPSGVDVFTGEALEAAFRYADMANLSFSYEIVTGVGGVDADSNLRLRSNPVLEYLEFVGFTADAANLTVNDLSGAVKVSLPEWNGEAVNVGALTPGLYFVTVDKTTFKFIKK